MGPDKHCCRGEKCRKYEKVEDKHLRCKSCPYAQALYRFAYTSHLRVPTEDSATTSNRSMTASPVRVTSARLLRNGTKMDISHAPHVAFNSTYRKSTHLKRRVWLELD